MNDKFYLKLKELAKKEVLVSEPMKNHTTFKIGGPADYFVIPETEEEIQRITDLCKEEQMPFYIIGNGSNLLVGDKGFRGVILRIYKTLDHVLVRESGNKQFEVQAGAGIMLSKLSHEIAAHSLTGFEFASGIPGTLGGAVTMNAGAYGGEIKDCITRARILDQQGNIREIIREDLELGYRSSLVQKEAMVVLEAAFVFQTGDKTEILKKMNELNERRREKQPLEYPSAGSTFKRPEGYFAGKLIMDSGLQGYRVGDVMISPKHCGFVINAGQGNARDAKKLIEDVDRIVFEKFKVHLEPEVRMIGEF